MSPFPESRQCIWASPYMHMLFSCDRQLPAARRPAALYSWAPSVSWFEAYREICILQASQKLPLCRANKEPMRARSGRQFQHS